MLIITLPGLYGGYNMFIHTSGGNIPYATTGATGGPWMKWRE